MSSSLANWQWALVALAAFLSGASKTGIAGIGIVSVALFALVWPGREAVGIVLLILICADCVAITAYPRQNARWDLLKRIFPWAGVGIALGTVAMGRITDTDVKRLIGAVLLFLVAAQFVQRLRRPLPPVDATAAPSVEATPLPPLWITALAGVAIGFTTMIANAAGPVMILYLLALRLPKLTFVGTSAWFFFILNLTKVPFSIHLGLINLHSAQVSLMLLPAAVIGGLAGKLVFKHIDQRFFEWSALVFTLLAGIRLLFS